LTSSPLFSIVTVTLNCASDAVLTARSVFSQDYNDFEYIVKDGGSTDGTIEQLQGLGIRNISVCPDSGIYHAMNQALSLCSGQYVYFLNAGDTFYNGTVLSEVAAKLDPKATVVYGNIHLHPHNRLLKPPAKLSRFFLFKKNLHHQSWMARLESYRSIGGFNLSYNFVADQDFLWGAVLKNKLYVHYVDVTLATFVYGGASTRLSSRKQVGQERSHLLKRYFTFSERLLFGLFSLYPLGSFKARIMCMLYPELKKVINR
jgi:putative colanic acid biosynthesis glycosyltransferase